MYLGLTLAIAFLMSHRNKTMDDHLLAGRKMPMYLAGVSMAATLIGTGVTLGVGEIAYKVGVSGVLYPLLLGISLAISMYIASARFRASNLYTLPELLSVHFGVRTRVILGIANALKWIGPIAAQYLAVGVAVQAVTGWDLKLTIVISSLVILMYVIVGGMWAISYTDLVQTVMVYAGLIIMFVVFHFEFGPITSVLTHLPESYADPFGIDLFSLTAWIGVVVGLGFVDQAWLQRSASVGTPKEALNAGMLAAILVFPIGFLSVYLGLVSKIILPEIDPKLALPQLVVHHYPSLFGGLFVGAIIAAGMSSTDSWIHSSAMMLTKDAYQLVRKDASEKELNFFLNLSTILIGLAGLGVALLWKGGIITLVMASLMLGSSVYIAPLLVQWFSPRKLTRDQGFGVILFLILVGICFIFVPKQYLFGIHPILSLSVLGYLITLILLLFGGTKQPENRGGTR